MYDFYPNNWGHWGVEKQLTQPESPSKISDDFVAEIAATDKSDRAAYGGGLALGFYYDEDDIASDTTRTGAGHAQNG